MKRSENTQDLRRTLIGVSATMLVLQVCIDLFYERRPVGEVLIINGLCWVVAVVAIWWVLPRYQEYRKRKESPDLTQDP